MNKYYQVTVQIRDISDKGKVTKTTEQYLCLSTGVTESEATIVKKFTDEGSNLDYVIKSVKETNILEVL